MALSLGSGRRRWPCRAARVGKGWTGCSHFHVHCHFPRQVRAFSPLRLPPLFSLLPYLLILPVLFFAVLALLVCFGWFTFVYFVSSLLRKCNNPECLGNDGDASEHCRNEEQARNEEETEGTVRALCGTANLVHLQSGQEFVANRKEAPVYIKSEILELIDKHETKTVVIICSDNSAENNVKSGADLPDDFFAKKIPEDFFDEQQDAQSDHTNKLREDHFIEEKEKHILSISDETIDLNTENVMSGLLLDSVSGNNYATVATSNASFDRTSSDEEDGHEKEHTEAEASGATSVACDFSENNQAIREEMGMPSTESNIHEVASGEISVNGRTEDEDENSCTSEGGSRGLHFIKRSEPPWWNLCGVLEVFAGCKD